MPVLRQYSEEKMSSDLAPFKNEILFYTAPDGNVRVDVVFQEELFLLNLSRY
jgi:hypothetical protein